MASASPSKKVRSVHFFLLGSSTHHLGSRPLQGIGEGGAERAPTPDLARQSLVLGLALLLRDHLKRLYGLSDAKLAKYVVGKKSAMGDKVRLLSPFARGNREG